MGKPDPLLCYAAIYNVKDHRTNEEISNVQGVMDGNIDPFINAYLAWITKTNH